MEYAATMNSMSDKIYQEIMKDSPSRKEAARNIVSQIEKISDRMFSLEDAAKIVDVITRCDIEDGVSVFLTSGAPRDKKLIGQIELPMEYMLIYFGFNRTPNARYEYAMGIHFRFKQNHELVRMNLETLKKEYPAFIKAIQESAEPGKEYQLMVYPKAAEFYAAVKSIKGQWLIQTPSSKGQFVPNRGIGFVEKRDNVIHIYEPHPAKKASRKYKKRVCFVF